jgi:vesicle coat complex subunit
MQCLFSIRDEVLPDVNCQLRSFDDEVDVCSQMISPVHVFFVSRTNDQIVHHLQKKKKEKKKEKKEKKVNATSIDRASHKPG